LDNTIGFFVACFEKTEKGEGKVEEEGMVEGKVGNVEGKVEREKSKKRKGGVVGEPEAKRKKMAELGESETELQEKLQKIKDGTKRVIQDAKGQKRKKRRRKKTQNHI